MANNGNSKDYKLLRYLFDKDTLVLPLKGDNNIDLLIKYKINHFVVKYAFEKRQNGWNNQMIGELNNLATKINQVRQKNWYFKPLKIK